MTLVSSLSLIILFYVIGSLPFALIFTKLFGLGDIRKVGSGNVGATNVLRTGNKFVAFIVLCFDIFKGFLPFLILQMYFQDISLLNKILLCHFAILGHIYPVWLKFKGGKGVATYVGILFAINFYLGLIFIFFWFITFFISRYSSLSSLISAASIPIYLLILTQFDQVIFFTIMFVLIFFTHRENIKRLKNKEETKTKIY